MKKILALIVALMIVMSMSALAAGTGTITITPPEGTDANATNTYKIYKVFDADGDGENISYKLVSGKTTAPAGFTVDAAGNVTYTAGTDVKDLTAADIAAIADYVKDDEPVATATATGTADAVSEALPNGYYYITTSSGTVVTINSTNPTATVKDKNTVPTVDKKAIQAENPEYVDLDAAGKNAIAQVGKIVNYEATVTVGKGAKNYAFHDKMSAGLELQEGITVTAAPAIEGTSWYTIKETPDTGDTITITFVDGIAENTKITIKYSAKVTSAALTVDPAKNTAVVTYGDENSNNKTPETEVKVYNAEISVLKKDGKNTDSTDDDEALKGAGFVLKNADGKYYKLDNGAVTWVDSIDAADEHVSGDDGKVPAFTGLSSGTYKLEEKTVPAGYNKAADVEVTIAEDNYESTNLSQEKTIVNNKGAQLPSTGGVGTTIFYIAGSILVLAAAVLLITKRRMGHND